MAGASVAEADGLCVESNFAPCKPAYSAFFDHDDPPFYKSFLRVDVCARAVDITCFGVKDEHSPAELVDRVMWTADAGWTTAQP